MRAIPALCLGLLAAVPACKPKPEAAAPPGPPRTQILKDIPVFIGAITTDTAGTEDAERASYIVRVTFDTVTAFYRRMLPTLGWQIMSDQGDSLMRDLYLRKAGQALWLHFEKPGLLATTYTIIGTRADSAIGTAGPNQLPPPRRP